MAKSKIVLLLIVLICSFQLSCTVGEVNEKIEDADFSELDMNHTTELTEIDLKVDPSIYGGIVDAVYKEMTVLHEKSEIDTHCEWLVKYIKKIEKKMSEVYPRLKDKMTTIGYTKMNLEYYVIEENGNCRKIKKNSISEKVKLKLDGVMGCAKPNDPNLIIPDGYVRSISKYHPKFKETPCYVETWYK